jgi:serine palmitoyltransferase
MDETVSFGTLGATGRGVTEHYNIPVEEVDLIAGSLENSLASVGGFCAGRAYVIDHQRLSGLGYCFSASAPPMLAQAAISALEVLEKSPDMLVKLEEMSRYAHSQLATIKFFSVSDEPASPVIHLRLAAPSGQRDDDLKTLRKVVELAEEKSVALTIAAYLDDEIHMPPPSIRVAINCELTHDEVDRIVDVLKTVVQQV